MRPLVQLSFFAVLALTFVSNVYPIPANTNLFITSFLTIYVGAHRRLVQMESEQISTKEAYMFPIMGSCALFGLYVVFKMFDKDSVNMLLKAYFLIVGIFAMASTLHPFAKDLMQRLAAKRKFKTYTKTHKFERKWALFQYLFSEPLVIEGDILFGICAAVSALVAGWYVYSKHWCFNNILGICFCIQGIENIGLGSVKVGLIILIGLFFYDVFWVFGTDVMVSVATKFDAPIKLLFPRALATEDTSTVLQMLGLGDIVMPGLFVAQLLRYDFHKAAGLKTQKTTTQAKDANGSDDTKAARKKELELRRTLKFSKPYFNVCILLYTLGLVTTVWVMHTFKHAQPALLYLVPACIGAVFLTGVLCGDLSDVLSFTEEEPEKGERKDK